MNRHNYLTFGVLSLAAFSANAQDGPRRAAFIGGGEPGKGRCTIEVVVDGAAEIGVRGDTANLRTVSGQPAQFRRFDCTSPMPLNPGNFRFSGVDGRGRQTLVGDPRSGGPAVVRIEDPQSGSDRYKFDLFWDDRGSFPMTQDRDRGAPPVMQDRDRDRGFGRPAFAADDAVRICREAIQQQASDRFRTRDIQFRRIAMDNNPGRNDWVTGVLTIGDRPEPVRFSCSVDFATGRVRSAEIEPGGDFRPPVQENSRAFQNCQNGVTDRLRADGYERITFRSVNAGDRPDRVLGSVNAFRRDGDRVDFEYSCVVEPRDGDLRSVDVRRP